MTMTKWHTFECEECGEIEEIDVGADAGEQICDCGALMIRIDGIVDTGDELHQVLGEALRAYGEKMIEEK
jgi:hypothetical protein